jgi:short-subunit dehydrogenase
VHDGKVALVTGGSAGIGLAVARRLVDAGATAILVARTRQTVEAAAASLGPRAIPWPMDVGDLAALAELPAAVVARFGRLDAVVNNAGAHHRGRVETRTTDELAAMVNVNLAAPIVLCRASLPHLPEGGAIVNVASLAGNLPMEDAATYSATKAGLRFFTRALAEEHRGLRISIVSPGPVDTGFFGEDLSKVSDIVFSQPMSSADDVAERVLACLDRPSTEIWIPRRSGWLGTFGYLFPGLARAIRPSMLRRGARGKAAYAARR